METIRSCWSVKELEQQIASLYYERSGLSKNKEALSALVQQQATLLQPKDVINTPVVEEGIVDGWDDPRLVSIAALRRRGFTPESIKMFVDLCGVSPPESNGCYKTKSPANF